MPSQVRTTTTRRFQRLGGDSRGTAVTEFALFTALLAGAVLISTAMMGIATRDTLETIASATSNAPQQTNAPLTTASHTAGQSRAAPANSPPSVWTALAAWQVAVLVGFIVGGSVLWWVVFGRRRKQQDDEKDEDAEDVVIARPEDAPLFAKRHAILRKISDNMLSLFEGSMTVKPLMSHAPTVVTPDATLEHLRELMKEKHVRHLLVCDGRDRLVGIISDRDVIGATGGTAGDLMTPDPVFTEPGCLISPAITLMLNRRISSLPVLENGKLIGLFTTTDLMMALQCSLQLLHRTTVNAAGETSLPLPSREPPDVGLSAKDLRRSAMEDEREEADAETAAF